GTMNQRLMYAVELLGMALGHSTVAAQDSGSAERFNRFLNFGALVRGGSVSPNWLADGSSFWYAEGAPDQTVIYRVDSKTNAKQPFFDVSRLRRALAGVLGREPPYQGVPFEPFTLIDGERA